MKKLLVITLVLALALGMTAGGALARTDIWAHVVNFGAHVELCEKTTLNLWRGFAGVEECVVNDGILFLDKALTYTVGVEPDYNPSVVEYKMISGCGDTQIFKEAWGVAGEFASDDFPLEVWLSWSLSQPPLLVEDAFYGRADEPFVEAFRYPLAIETDAPFDFVEKYGIDEFPCEYEPPQEPQPPCCHYIEIY